MHVPHILDCLERISHLYVIPETWLQSSTELCSSMHKNSRRALLDIPSGPSKVHLVLHSVSHSYQPSNWEADKKKASTFCFHCFPAGGIRRHPTSEPGGSHFDLKARIDILPESLWSRLGSAKSEHNPTPLHAVACSWIMDICAACYGGEGPRGQSASHKENIFSLTSL